MKPKPLLRVERLFLWVARFLDERDPDFCAAAGALEAESGYPPAMAREALKTIFKPYHRSALLKFQKKLQSDPKGDAGHSWGCVLPGNTPGPLVDVLMRSALLGAGLDLKFSSRHQRTGRALVRSFIRATGAARVRTAVSRSGFWKLRTYWSRLIVFGSDETVRKFEARAGAGCSYEGQGHRISAAVIFKSALSGPALARTARCAARDVWLFDQKGCLSPQVFFVQNNAAGFAALLSRELKRLEQEHGQVRRSAGEKALRRSALERLRSAALDSRILEWPDGPPSGESPVVYVWKHPAAPPLSGYQVAAVREFGQPTQIIPLLKPFKQHLQAIGFAGSASERRLLASAAKRALAAKQDPLASPLILPLGRMQQPPPAWNL